MIKCKMAEKRAERWIKSSTIYMFVESKNILTVLQHKWRKGRNISSSQLHDRKRRECKRGTVTDDSAEKSGLNFKNRIKKGRKNKSKDV